ncbi:unnamed protein product [Merluccius merluccius]
MDQARTTISKIFNGEPRSYTRFNLTQNMEGDNSHVEMKLSADADEEVEGNGVGEHHRSNGVHGPYMVRRTVRSQRNVCFLLSATLLIFIIGYLIGYLVHRKKEETPSCPLPNIHFEIPSSPVEIETGAAPLMDWDKVKTLLAEQLSTTKLEDAFRDLTSENHQAGTPGDDALANVMMKKFKSYYMQAWTDEHFVKIQELGTKVNRVTFKGNTMDLSGFLSYSAKGSITGAIIYAYYGQTKDFMQLGDVNLSGRVVLVKAGKISFAEKVANAAKRNASAVLIYSEAVGDSPLYGHVHLGSGDPYTPGFPSFNHTQFAPVESSGLPTILAQTIPWSLASSIMNQLGGHTPPSEWRDVSRLGSENDVVTVEVNNVLVEKRINNVLAVIKGFVDPDRYVILGAQRDAWGTGFAEATVGTSILMELARAISHMVKHEGFLPRRSIVFASWSAGQYGNIGSTEWLEGYLSSLSMKAFSYINLDGVVTGGDGFRASASHLLQTLMETTVKEVRFKNQNRCISDNIRSFQSSTFIQPMQMEDAAYPFLTFSGIPSVSFQITGTSDYPYFGTRMDTRERLNIATRNQMSQLVLSAAQVAGHMTLRLVHDHLLRFDLSRYDLAIHSYVAKINRNLLGIQKVCVCVCWIIAASGSYSRAASNLIADIENSQLDNVVMCREINDRLMQVERNLLSPYVSPRDSPFRHIIVGSGPQTVQALLDYLEAIRLRTSDANAEAFQNQLALATWTIQGCANSLEGDIWSLDNEI